VTIHKYHLYKSIQVLANRSTNTLVRAFYCSNTQVPQGVRVERVAVESTFGDLKRELAFLVADALDAGLYTSIEKKY